MAEDSLEFALEWPEAPGKFKSTVTHILSKHGTEVRLLAEERFSSASHLSKKKLKDLIAKQNNEILAFFTRPEKTLIMGAAESIFRRYGHEVPTLKSSSPSFLTELNMDATLDAIVMEYNESLGRIKESDPMNTYLSQTRWFASQYKTIGEEVLRLETTLFQKIESLDKLQSRVPSVTNLEDNEAVPDLIRAFSAYAEKVYQSSGLEENYRSLIECYKKWNVCRQIMTVPLMMRQESAEPQCSICLLEPISNVIVPCGHTFCGVCSKKQNTTCYICRGPIRERVKLFFA
jgi:hypothetical protein